MVEEDAKWEDQEMEIETLKSIYTDEELTVKREKPYNFEIQVNSNTESEDRNYLKLLMIFDLPDDYPNEIPYFRIKNLAPDYIDNNALEVFEGELREQAQESLGQMMIFELVDMLKEKITNINEVVLNKLDKIEESESIANQNKDVLRTDGNKLSYTPVNQETFAIWCADYMERLRIEREATLTGNEDKPTGKELFEDNKSAFDDLVFEEEDETAPVVQEEEEQKQDEDEEGDEDFVYDKALYDADGLEDEDVDFDD